MMRLYTSIKLSILTVFAFSFGLNSQVLMSENFNDGNMPTGWGGTFGTTTNLPCEDAYSIRDNIWTSSGGELTTNMQTALGGDIDVSFNYKIVEYGDESVATTGDFGIIDVQYSIDNGTTWVNSTTIDVNNHIVSTDCANVNYTIPGVNVPNGSQFIFRLFITYNTGDYYLYVDEFSAIEVVFCPMPTGLSFTNGTSSTADISWNASNNSAGYVVEYGTPGFTPGTGAETGSTSTTNTFTTLSGLMPNQFYEVYVQSDCSSESSVWAGPISINTYGQGLYMYYDSQCPTSGFVDISATGTDAGVTDDGEFGVSMPFPLLYQGVLVQDLTIGNNGGIELGTLTGNVGYGGDMTTLNDGLHPWGDDMDEETGNVYFETIGTAPNRVFIVQWDNLCNFSGTVGDPTVTFQVQLEEATHEIYYVYSDVVFGGSFTDDDYAANADIGLAGPNYDFNVSNDDPTYLTNNSCVHFAYTNCETPSGLVSTSSETTFADISWDASNNSTGYTIEWGAPGFTPGTGSETGSTTSTTNSVTITGLTPFGNYDVYVQSNCSPDNSGWAGPLEINTFGQGQYVYFDNQCPANGFVDISTTGTDTGVTDDGELGVTMPFPLLFQGSLIQDLTIGNNGGIELGTLTGDIAYGGNMNTLNDGLYLWGDDLDEETGNVYYETIGTAPNRVFIVQWDNICNWSGSVDDSTVTFQVQIEEATHEIYYVYTDVVFGGDDAADDYAANADIGLAGPNVDVTVSTQDSQYLMENSCVHFYYSNCPSQLSAGPDGALTACRNEPVDLNDAISANADPGSWFDPSGNPVSMPHYLSGISGWFDYTYVATMPDCDGDTAHVIVTVEDCDYVGIEENMFNSLSIYPNPTKGTIFIQNPSISEEFDIKLIDLNGKELIEMSSTEFNGEVIEINAESIKPGMYLLRVFNASSEKVFRIVKE